MHQPSPSRLPPAATPTNPCMRRQCTSTAACRVTCTTRTVMPPGHAVAFCRHVPPPPPPPLPLPLGTATPTSTRRSRCWCPTCTARCSARRAWRGTARWRCLRAGRCCSYQTSTWVSSVSMCHTRAWGPWVSLACAPLPKAWRALSEVREAGHTGSMRGLVRRQAGRGGGTRAFTCTTSITSNGKVPCGESVQSPPRPSARLTPVMASPSSTQKNLVLFLCAIGSRHRNLIATDKANIRELREARSSAQSRSSQCVA